MSFENISYEVDAAGIARLTLNRPDAGNAIDFAMARELFEAATACSCDSSVRVVLLRANGANFCVGGDLRSFARQADLPHHLKEVTTYLHAAVSRLARLDAPMVGAVRGSAAGAGFSLACLCDLVIAADSAKFLMAYTRVGLSPDGSATWSLPRLVGLGRALDLALLNEPLSAERALDWGILTKVVPDGELDAAAERMAADLAAGPTGAYAATKRLLRDSFFNPIESQMELETLALAANGGLDGPEGINSFLEKRPGSFRRS